GGPMTRWKTAVTTIALGLAIAGRAQGTVLTTAPADTESPVTDVPGQMVSCSIVNVSKFNVGVTIELHTYGGAGIMQWHKDLGPGQAFTPDTTDGGSYCKFEFNAPAASVRAAALYMTVLEGNLSMAIPAK